MSEGNKDSKEKEKNVKKIIKRCESDLPDSSAEAHLD